MSEEAARIIGALTGLALVLFLTLRRRRNNRSIAGTHRAEPAARPSSAKASARLSSEAPPASSNFVTISRDSSARIEALRQNLRVKFLYDEVRIDRAIAFERVRNPEGDIAELMQSAIERWERDNR
jgi:MYXO-CTERM domain-containing protein